MRSSRKAIIVSFVVGVILFGYSQYAFASQIEIGLAKSNVIEESDNGQIHSIQLEFENASFLFLTLGKSEFDIYRDGQKIGQGDLNNFVLPPLSKISVDGTFVTDTEISDEETNNLRIDGILNYDLVVLSVDIPFVYYPTQDQAREFIQQN